MTPRMKWILLGCATLAATCFGVFVLPFLSPPAAVYAVSAANAAGFNNRVAEAAAGAITLAMLGAAWRFGLRVPLPTAEECTPMSRRFVLGWTLALGVVVALLGWVAYLSDLRYLGEARYFIEQMGKSEIYRLKLYEQLEFPYGPLLFYPTLWLAPLFRHAAHPLQAAYVATLILHQVAGLLLLAYVMQQLPIVPRLRRWIFSCMACFVVFLGLGLNYTFLRFAAPLASLLFCLRAKRISTVALLVFAGEIVNLGISSEMGFAFAIGVLCFAILQWVQSRRVAWLLVATAPLAGGAVFLAFVGNGYFNILRLYSGGVFNLIVEPQPYVLVFLFALVWLAPLTIVSAWGERRQDALVWTALFAMGFALVPAALGRADVGHMVFEGLALFLLALIPVGAWHRRGQWIWITAMFVVMLMSQAILVHLYRGPYEQMVEILCLRHAPLGVRRVLLRWKRPSRPGVAEQLAMEHASGGARLDVARLRSITGGAKVATPGDLAPEDEDSLRNSGMYMPGYYAFETATLSEYAEREVIDATNQAEWLLLQDGVFPTFTETPERVRYVSGLPFPYSTRQPFFQYGLQMEANVNANWQQVATLDGYTLYRRTW